MTDETDSPLLITAETAFDYLRRHKRLPIPEPDHEAEIAALVNVLVGDAPKVSKAAPQESERTSS